MRQAIVVLAAALAGIAEAVYYQISNNDEIKESARTLAYDMSTYYKGNQSGQIVGILPGPPDSGNGDYYWYVAGAMFGTYIDYWHLTGDDSYNTMVINGMIAQIGDQKNYEPANWSLSLGNDDQAFWGMAALSAAETKFPNPPADKPTWIDLAHTVWNMQYGRLDNLCNGGLHWQARSVNKGYDYKNVIANACFMNIGARLARYTGNVTFLQQAEATWDWMWGLNYIDHETWAVYDGANAATNCTDLTKFTFTANGAVLIEAVAFLYNYVLIPFHPSLLNERSPRNANRSRRRRRVQTERNGATGWIICSTSFSSTTLTIPLPTSPTASRMTSATRIKNA